MTSTPRELTCAFRGPAAQQASRFQDLAIQTFRLLGCEGMARVDFFLAGNDISVNEVNTLPGFT